ncbi:MAG: DUF1688 family protein [Rhizobiales bacterium]|nr:DUF1688 family protein [Hyphomicrobiales bacterium]
MGALVSSAEAEALSLLSSEAVRARAHTLLTLGLRDELLHFRVASERLEVAADLVADTTRAAYPSLDVPLHSRWRHFEFQGVDRWSALSAERSWQSSEEAARAAFDLAVVSVLLDAGAGMRWTYKDRKSGAAIGRSEGLALATLTMFEDGLFSADPRDPLRVDAAVLAHLPMEEFRRGLQASDENPLVGIEGRLNQLRRLGQVMIDHPEAFAQHDSARPGGLFDVLAAGSKKQVVPAPAILSTLLRHLTPIWPSRETLAGVPLGDCWRHPLLRTPDTTDGLVPLHKLLQWLAYSLIEPLQWAGYEVTDLDGLTGLAEYRNGGLLVDSGVLTLRDHKDAMREHSVGSPLVVEWRALTVALLDELAGTVRRRLNVDAAAFPLAKVLQGGTWTAGRSLARKLRSDGSPPIRVASDGSVF